MTKVNWQELTLHSWQRLPKLVKVENWQNWPNWNKNLLAQHKAKLTKWSIELTVELNENHRNDEITKIEKWRDLDKHENESKRNCQANKTK